MQCDCRAQLARLLLEDPEANRTELGERMFDELTRLRELNERRELKKMALALEERDRQKDQFIAVLAHELRNPLAAIRAATYALRLLNLKDDRAGPLVGRVDRQTTAIARMLGLGRSSALRDDRSSQESAKAGASWLSAINRSGGSQ